MHLRSKHEFRLKFLDLKVNKKMYKSIVPQKFGATHVQVYMVHVHVARLSQGRFDTHAYCS